MRRFVLASMLVVAVAGPVLAEEACLFTNDDILKVVSAGLADSAILTLMARCQPNYDTSPEALAALKSKGVSDAVIAAMVNPPAPGASPPPAQPADETKAPVEELGAYLVLKNGVIKKMPTSMTTSKGSAGRVAADVLVPFAAFARRKHKQTIPGTAADLRVAEAELEHFFYFTSPGSPVDTQLLRLVSAQADTKKNIRILGATLTSVTGGQQQEENSIPISLKVTKVPGLYRITPERALGKGEYALVYGQFGQARTFMIQEVWDFGID